MKKYRLFLVFTIALFLITGCQKNQTKTVEEDTFKPVAVTELKEEYHPIILDYVGTVNSKDIKRYSFKVSGKVAKVFVQEGQEIQSGDDIALLEKEDLNFSLETAKKKMEATKAQYDKAVKGAKSEEILLRELDVKKAKENYIFIKDTYEDIKKLYDKGAVAENKLKETKLKLNQSKDSLKQAENILKLTKDGAMDEEIKGLYKQYEIAKVDYEAKKKLVKDSLITSDCNGYILKVLSKENEIIGAGAPVVVICSDEYEVTIGLTQEDVCKIKTGNDVKVYINDKEIDGTITTINKIPDEESRTYSVKISLNGNNSQVNIGAIAKVSITEGLKKGIWIPIKYVLNNGEDYVFVFENGRAKRKNVKIRQLLEDIVWVEGLEEGDVLITEGIKSIKDGYKVKATRDIRSSMK